MTLFILSKRSRAVKSWKSSQTRLHHFLIHCCLFFGWQAEEKLGYALSQIYELRISMLSNRYGSIKMVWVPIYPWRYEFYSRLLPCFKRNLPMMIRERFLEKANYSLDDVYPCLSPFLDDDAKNLPDLATNDHIKRVWQDAKLICMMLPNYYFWDRWQWFHHENFKTSSKSNCADGTLWIILREFYYLTFSEATITLCSLDLTLDHQKAVWCSVISRCDKEWQRCGNIWYTIKHHSLTDV